MDHHHEFGDMFEIWGGRKRLVFLSNRSLIEKIYTPNVNNKFFARLQVPYLEKIGLQHGLVFNNDYQIWKRNRKLVVQALKSPRFLRQFTKLVQSSFNENESFWDKKEYHFDFAKWIKHFTTDITLRTTTSSPSYCLHAYLFGEEHVDPIKSEEIKKSIKLSHAEQNSIIITIKVHFTEGMSVGFVLPLELNCTFRDIITFINDLKMRISVELNILKPQLNRPVI
ncbi:12807_t:CDS:2 [Funneliformis mosseae]|uniref:12807_t:CDS:1 n=1 Tax=Funneliformis mosseae TaxID=27381 RepID=A0A9N9ESU4_FUNMO|nr:12807_t:CDS:2 [Funneliformis mosseae]